MFNVLDIFDRVFYTKDNGEVFECFKNSPMELVSLDEWNDLMVHGRAKQISSISIAEQQLNELIRIFKNKKLRNLEFNQEETIKAYNEYGIISDEELKELIELVKGGYNHE